MALLTFAFSFHCLRVPVSYYFLSQNPRLLQYHPQTRYSVLYCHLNSATNVHIKMFRRQKTSLLYSLPGSCLFPSLIHFYFSCLSLEEQQNYSSILPISAYFLNSVKNRIRNNNILSKHCLLMLCN